MLLDASGFKLSQMTKEALMYSLSVNIFASFDYVCEKMKAELAITFKFHAIYARVICLEKEIRRFQVLRLK